MLKKISIKGYKCLKDISIKVGSLNIFVGPNAAGKSSVLQALLLLRQSADVKGTIDGLHLSGLLYEAGTVRDIFHPDAKQEIELTLNTNKFLFNYSDEDRESKTPIRVLRIAAIKKLPLALYDRSNGFAYLNAERIGPRVSYSLPPDTEHIAGLVGKHGEYTCAYLARAFNDDRKIDDWKNTSLFNKLAETAKKLDNRDLLESLNNTNGRLDLVCNLMLSWILPGSNFQTEENDINDSATLLFKRQGDDSKFVRTTHVGFGLTYTLPIITAALALKKEGMLLVENPEAHLHPFSQSRIGVFLAIIAATGRQIFIETHSDHVLNGIRLAVKNRFVPATDVCINFFSPLLSDSSSIIKQIPIDNDGYLDEWPKGFFDQIEEDLSKL